MKKLLLSTAIFFLSFPVQTYAASFDCANAFSATEKLICSSESISKLDEQLASVYKAGLDAVTNKDVFKKMQVDWIKQQRACKNAECLAQTYQTRINQLSSSTNSSLAVIDNATQSSVITSKPKFNLTKGQQYEVCRVFNDYLNSPYYNKGDCTIKEYPTDKRLRSPEYKQVDIFQYEDYLTENYNYRTDEENARRITNTKARMKSGELTAWTTTLDVKNDGKKEAVISTRRYWSLEEAKTQSCDGLGGGINRLVNGKIDDSAWNGHLGEPILFDGRTFLLYGGEAEYSIYEPMSIEHYRSGQDYHGKIATVEICNFEIKN